METTTLPELPPSPGVLTGAELLETVISDTSASITTGQVAQLSQAASAVDAQSRVDTLSASLSNPTNINLGAGLVGFKGRTVANELNDLSVPVTRFGAVGDFNGVTGTNNKQFFKDMFASLGDNQTGWVPKGDFLVDVVNSDLTDLGFNRDFAFIFQTGRKGIMLAGPGRIHFRCSGTTKRALFITFKDSDNCHLYKTNITGDLVKQDAAPNSETGVGMGAMFYNCTGSGIRDAKFKDLIIPWWFTGQPISPATVTSTSSECYVTNTTHDNFEQCSTFGAGASGLSITNNRFIDPYIAFKISQTPSGDAAAGKAGRILFSGNQVHWRSSAQFAAVFFSPTFSEAAVGVMVECANTDIFISDNIIDLTDITVPSLPPVSNAGPVVLFSSPNNGTGGILSTNRVTVIGNQLVAKEGYSTRFAIDSSASIKNLVIDSNRHVGGIRVQSGSVPALRFEDLTIKGNVGKGLSATTMAMTLGAGRFRDISILNNVMEGNDGVLTSGNTEIMNITGFTCDRLIIKGNILPGGTISNFGATAVTCGTLEITENTIRSIDLSTIGTLAVDISGTALTTGTAYKLVLDAATKATCRVSISGKCKSPTGGNVTTAVNLNGGLLRLDSTQMFANSGSAFTFDSSVVLQGGNYYGSGAPVQSAFMGVQYVDLNAASDGNYIKTSSTGSTLWKKIATV